MRSATPACCARRRGYPARRGAAEGRASSAAGCRPPLRRGPYVGTGGWRQRTTATPADVLMSSAAVSAIALARTVRARTTPGSRRASWAESWSPGRRVTHVLRRRETRGGARAPDVGDRPRLQEDGVNSAPVLG